MAQDKQVDKKIVSGLADKIGLVFVPFLEYPNRGSQTGPKDDIERIVKAVNDSLIRPRTDVADAVSSQTMTVSINGSITRGK